MNRWPLILLLLLIANAAFAQKGKDTVVYNLPVVSGKLVYADSIKVPGHSKAVLDSAAKKWLISYFQYHWADTLSKDKDNESCVLTKALLEFRAPPNSIRAVYYDYYLLVTVKIDCKNGYYTYKVFDTYFRPKSGFFNKVVIHPTSPDYLIDIYKKKHYGFMTIDGSTIRYYLACVNTAILKCIASLNKAMAN